MALPFLFAAVNSATGQNLDDDFAAVGALGVIPCTAAGTNAIVLTPIAGNPTVSTYANYLLFGFVATATSTGAVTIGVGSLALLASYFPKGVIQLGSGNIQIGVYYIIGYNSALNSGSGGWFLVSATAAPSVPDMRGYLGGLTLSNDTVTPNTILDIAAGVAMNSTNVALMTLSSAFTKTTGAFVAGTGNGGLDTGAVAASTFYHVYVIQNLTTQAVDVIFSTSAISPTLPSGFTIFRRIGTFSTNGSSNINVFNQNGDEFLLGTPVTAFNTTIGLTASLVSITGLPTGVKLNALLNGYITSTTGTVDLLITSPDQTDTAASSTITTFRMIAAGTAAGGVLNVRSSTLSQIRARGDFGTISLVGTLQGWQDLRGRQS